MNRCRLLMLSLLVVMCMPAYGLSVGSPLEIPLTILGWLAYAGIWGSLQETGLAYVPFLLVLVKVWKDSREKMDDSEAARATVRILETRLIVMFSVVVLAAQPIIPVQITGLTYSKTVCDNGTESTSTVTGGNTGTTYDRVFNSTSLGGSTAQAPVWWYGVMAVSSGLTNAAIASLPCSPDLRGVSYRLDLNPVRNDPALMRELVRFYDRCYRPALSKMQQEKPALPPGFRPVDVEWLGAPFLVGGYYRTLWAAEGVPGFPPDPNRVSDMHAARAIGTVVAALPMGVPRCDQWWNGTTLDNGLRERLAGHLINPDPGAWSTALGYLQNATGMVRGFFGGMSESEVLLRGLLEKDNALLRQLASDGSVGLRQGGVGGAVASGAAKVGLWWEKATLYPKMVVIREGVRNVQAVLLMAVYALLPFVLVFSNYSFSVLFTATAGVFAIKFMGFLWALAFWLDSHLLDSLDSLGVLGLYESGDPRRDVIDYVAMGTYLGLPLIWMMLLSWAGVRIGREIADTGSNLGASAAAAGARGGAAARDTTVNAAKGKLKK